MRLASRFFRRADQCLAPATPADLLDRSVEAATDLIEATRGSGRGRSAATAAAVGVTLIVATAAYVWWKRRDQVAVLTPEPAAPPAPFAPIANTVAPAPHAHEATSEFDGDQHDHESVLPVVATQLEESAPANDVPIPVEAAMAVAEVSIAPVNEREHPLNLPECGDARRATPQP